MDSTRRAIAAQKRERQKGLTLFELIGVLVILGIVAAIAVPAVAGVIRDAETSADTRMMESVGNTVSNYLMARDQNGDCKDDISGTTIAVTSTISCSTSFFDFKTGITDQRTGASTTGTGQHKYAWVSTQHLKVQGYLNTDPFYRLEDKIVNYVLALYVQAPNDYNGRWTVPDLTTNKLLLVQDYHCKQLQASVITYARTFDVGTSFPDTTNDACPAR